MYNVLVVYCFFPYNFFGTGDWGDFDHSMDTPMHLVTPSLHDPLRRY